MTPLRERILGAVLARHGIKLSNDDPFMWMLTAMEEVAVEIATKERGHTEAMLARLRLEAPRPAPHWLQLDDAEAVPRQPNVAWIGITMACALGLFVLGYLLGSR